MAQGGRPIIDTAKLYWVDSMNATACETGLHSCDKVVQSAETSSPLDFTTPSFVILNMLGRVQVPWQIFGPLKSDRKTLD